MESPPTSLAGKPTCSLLLHLKWLWIILNNLNVSLYGVLVYIVPHVNIIECVLHVLVSVSYCGVCVCVQSSIILSLLYIYVYESY